MGVAFANNAVSTLAAPITDTDTTLTVQAADAGKFPVPASGDWFPLTVERNPNEREIMRVTARAGATLTVERGQEGTAPLEFEAGHRVEHRLTAGVLELFMLVGAFGLGANNASVNVPDADLDALRTNGLWRAAGNVVGNPFGITAQILHMGQGGNNAQQVAFGFVANGILISYRRLQAGSWAEWVDISGAGKATAAQGALAETALQASQVGWGASNQHVNVPGLNIDTLNQSGVWRVTSTTVGNPLGAIGQLLHMGQGDNVAVQMLFRANSGAGEDIRFRRRSPAGVWTEWTNISGAGKATFAYVDEQVSGVGHQIAPVNVCAVTNLTKSGIQTVDGQAGSAGMRVLQAVPGGHAQNGIWVMAAGSWSRATDSDTWDELRGARMLVLQGSSRAGSTWSNTNGAGGSLGTTPVTYEQSGVGAVYTGTSGVDVSGTVIQLASTVLTALGLAETALQASQVGWGANNQHINVPGGNMDTLNQNGVWRVNSTTVGNPLGALGQLLHMGQGENVAVQVLFRANSGTGQDIRFRRRSVAGEWTDFTNISGAGKLAAAQNLNDLESKQTALDNLTYQFDAGGPALSLPNHMRRRYIDVGAYCSLTDTADVRVGVAAALADAAGREMVFTAPYGQARRRYRRSTRSGGFWTMADAPSRIVFEGGYLDCSDLDRNAGNVYFSCHGSIEAAEHTLASHAGAGSDQIVLSSGGANYAPGDYILIHSNGSFGLPADAATERRGEFARVKSRSGNTLTLYGPLEDNYITTINARIQKVNFKRAPVVENPEIYGPGRPDASGGVFDRAFSFLETIGAQVLGGKIDRVDYNGIRLNNSIHWKVDGVEFLFDPQIPDDSSHIQYGIVTLNCASYGEISNNLIWGSKHGIDHSRNSSNHGVGRHIDIHHNKIRDTWSAAIATHNNCERWNVHYNTIIGCNSGVNIRTRNSKINDNTIIFTPNANVGHGVDLRTDMVGMEVQRNEIHRGRYGVRAVTGALVNGGGQQFLINENKIYDASINGILAQFSDGGHKDNIFVNRNLVRRPGLAGAAIAVHGQDAAARVRNGSISDNEIWGGTAGVAIQGSWMERMAIVNNRTDRPTPVSVTNSVSMLTAPNYSLA